MKRTDNASVLLCASSRQRHQEQKRKRRNYFLKGPLPFGWIKDNIPDPVSRVLLVARAFMDMEGRDTCTLGQKVWDCAGISSRDQRRRVLQTIRAKVPGYRVIDRKGRSSILVAVNSADADGP